MGIPLTTLPDGRNNLGCNRSEWPEGHKMIIRSRLALLTSVAAVAFDNPGWKMDGDKIAVDGDGNPVWIGADGKEMSVRGNTIADLGREAKQHREKAQEQTDLLNKYKGDDGKLIDPDTAKSAIKTVGDIDASKLIDAGKLDEVKNQIKTEYENKLNEVTNNLKDYQSKYENKLVDDVFNSDFMENVAMPRDFFSAAMRNHFKVEDGKVVAYDKAGNRVMSDKNVGEYADPVEALKIIVDKHPQKDTILKADVAGGSGGGGGGGARGGGRRMSRADFNALNPVKQAEVAELQSKGELVIHD